MAIRLLSSESISGSLTISGTLGLSGTTAQYVRGDGAFTAFPAIPPDPTGVYLPLAGGTLTGTLIGTTATFGGTVTFNDHTIHPDQVSSYFGTGNDASIQHNGSHLFIDNSVGSTYLRNTSTGSILLRNSTGGDIQFDNEFAGNILFNTSNIERMRIDSDGKIQVGSDKVIWAGGYGGALVIRQNNATGDRLIKMVTVDSTGAIANDNVLVAKGANVGIGTDSPSGALHVKSSTATTTGMVRLQNDMDNNYETLRVESLGNYDAHIGFLANGTSAYWWGIGIDYSDSGKFKISGDNILSVNPRLTIDTSGNVGIGTTSPTVKFHVLGNPNSKGVLGRMEGSSTLGALIQYDRGSSYSWTAGIGGASATAGIPESYFGISETTNTPRFVIAHTTGNVGIGTTSPAAGLQVAKGGTTIPTAGASTASAVFGNSTSDDNYGVAIGANSSGVGYISSQRTDGTATTYNLAIQPNGGNVGIGTDSPTTNYPLTLRSKSGDYTKILDWGTDVGGSWGTMQISISAPYATELRSGAWNFAQGNVGIGTDAPGQKLAIEGSGTANENILRVNNQGQVSSRIWLRNAGQSAYIFNSGTTADTLATGILGQAFGMGINNNSSIQFYNGVTASVKMTILPSGNVGIGRTQADEKLEVEGNIKAKDVTGLIYSMVASWSAVASKNDLFSYAGGGGALWEYTINLNPNTAGSGAYTDYYYGKLGVGIGWNGSALTQYIWQQEDQTAPRTLYPSGGGNYNPLFRMYYSGGVYTELAYGTAWTLRIQGLSTSSSGEIIFRRLG
jgi:hypothetical protein